MAIYARKNLVINPAGPNIVVTQPLTNGNILVWDASLGSYINQPVENIIQGENLGDGEIVFKEKDGLTLKFKTIVAGANIILTPTDDELLISANPSFGNSSITPIAPNIAARDALIPDLVPGSNVFVTDAGVGEYALYLWTGTQFVTLATQDSAATDAQTLQATLQFNSASQIQIGSVSPGSRATLVTVKVITPFSSSATLNIGDDNNGFDSLMSNASIDLGNVGDYMIQTDLLFGGTQETMIKAYYNSNGSVTGLAQILVSYV